MDFSFNKPGDCQCTGNSTPGYIGVFSSCSNQGSSNTGNSSSPGTTPMTPLEFRIGVTPGAPVAGTTTFTNLTLINRNIVLFISKVIQNKIDDGSGAYYTKPFASDTITLTGFEWEDGTYVQIFEV